MWSLLFFVLVTFNVELILWAQASGGYRIFEKGGGRSNGKVTLGLLKLNINV